MVTGDSGELGLCKIWLTVLRGLDSVQYNLKKSHGLVRNTFYTELHLEMGTLITKLKSRGITLPTKVRLVKAMVFPVVMYGCESWTIKKAEHQRINTFELLEKTVESPLDCKKIKPVNPNGNQP